MNRKAVLLAFVIATFATNTNAASCPSDAPEGYKWLSGYVDEFQKDGTVSKWFTDSLAQHPKDIALLGLKAFFDANGDTTAARALFKKQGGSDYAFSIAMACAKVE